MENEVFYKEEGNRRVVWNVLAQKAQKDELAWNMLQNNSIEGIICYTYYCVDDRMHFCYPYANMQSLDLYLQKKKADFSTLMWILEGFTKVLEIGDGFLLSHKGYALQPEIVFLDHMKKRVWLCYLPGREGNFEEEFMALIEFLLEQTEHKSRKGVELVYGLYDLVVTEGFLLERVIQYLHSFQDELALQNENRKDVQRGLGLDEREADRGNAVSLQGKKEILCDEKMEKERFILRYVPFWEKKKGLWKSLFCRYREKKLSDLFIHASRLSEYRSRKAEILVGKDSICELSIAWETLSLQHAYVGIEDNQFYVIDKNSEEGTYINGQKISAMVKTICNTGDILTFADISYRICRVED